MADETTKKPRDDFSGAFAISDKFAVLNRLITRDLNNIVSTPKFYRYTKDEIATYLKNPYQYRKQLRDAVTYIYGASVHFRRLIQYFVGLTELAYVINLYRMDPATTKPKTITRNYRKTLNVLSIMNIRSQFPDVIAEALRNDTCYLTMWVTNDSITFQHLPPDYCDVSTIEGNVLNVTFDFSFFSSNNALLEFYPSEFTTKYNAYQKDRKLRWQELDSPTSFAIKVNRDILEYPLPPFAGLLRNIYDLSDYEEMKLTKTALENYAMVVMTLGMDEDGNWQIDLDKAKTFFQNLEAVLPEEVGAVMSPMPLSKISFEKSNTGDIDTVADAEQHLYSAAGVSSLLFNNEKASANALSLAIKADQEMTFGIVKSIEDAINRYIQSQNYGKYYKVTFLDVSIYNQKEMGDQYLKACQYGIPMVSYYAASQGLGQAELDSMAFLENEVLGLDKLFKPLQSSSTRSSSDGNGATDEGGAPKKDTGELTDSGEIARERE